MTINQLNENLEKALFDFSDEIRERYEEGSNKPATVNDINEVARQSFYAMLEFKEQIIKYLKSN